MAKAASKAEPLELVKPAQTIEFKTLNELEFDSENPRLPSTINGNNEKDVISWMLSDASILELMGSIGEKGFFPGEPILAIPSKRKGVYTVIEGNRRFTAVKLLNSPNLANTNAKQKQIAQIIGSAKFFPTDLPVVIFPSREEIEDYLGFKHITGVKSWSALAKAKYLKRLSLQHSDVKAPDIYVQLARAIGSRSGYVRELLVGLALYDIIQKSNFFDIPDLNEESIDFGVFYNAIKYTGIIDFLKIDPSDENPTRKLKKEHLRELTQWISQKDEDGQTALGESRNLSRLSLIVAEPKALQAFRAGRDIESAALYTGESIEMFRRLMDEAMSTIIQANQSLAHVNKLEASDQDMVKEVLLTVRQIQATVSELVS